MFLPYLRRPIDGAGGVIMSGRCHGPNCSREASAGFWCSEQCFGVWQWTKSNREIAHLAPMAGAANMQAAPVDQLDTNPQVSDNNSRSEHVERGWLRRALDVLYRRGE